MGPRLTTGLGVSLAPLLALLLALGGVANADDPGGSGANGPDVGRLDSGLQILAEASADDEQVTAQTGLERGDVTVLSGARVDDEQRVLVDVHVDGDARPAAAALRRLGMAVLVAGPNGSVSGWLPAGRLVDATAVPGVRAITAVRAKRDSTDGADAGSVLSEGDEAHHGPAARALGTTGSGVAVGIISDSMDQIGGGVTASQASGDLPASVTVLADDAGPFATDEGRAMAEIVYDGAPGISQMYFSTGTISAQGKANSIAGLVAQGVDVIADDIYYLDEPMFQDGVVAQAVDAAEAAGVTYLASAGNRARQSWEGTLTLSGVNNDFDPGAGVDTVQTLGTFSGRTPFIAVQWAEPWGAATVDLALDLYVDGVLVPTPDTDNVATGLPLEFEEIAISGTHSLGIGIRRVAGTGLPLLKYIVGGVPTFGIEEHATASQAINPDAASAAGSLAVAASRWNNPAFPEPFSSRGPAVVRRFDALGDPILEVRAKPALAAADGVATTVPGFQPFFGTSASTPSAAAVAVLVRSARPSLTVDQVASIMQNPANALDCVVTAGAPDADCGAGFVLADRAVAQALDVSPPRITPVTSPARPNGRRGWFTSAVTVGWDVSDTASPIVASTGCGTVSRRRNGPHTLTCAATSWGGSTTGSTTVKVDKSPPVIVRFKGMKRHYEGGALPVRSEVGCKAKDPVSGIERCTIHGFRTSAGTHTLRATAVNGAGQRTRATFTYTIR